MVSVCLASQFRMCCCGHLGRANKNTQIGQNNSKERGANLFLCFLSQSQLVFLHFISSECLIFRHPSFRSFSCINFRFVMFLFFANFKFYCIGVYQTSQFFVEFLAYHYFPHFLNYFILKIFNRFYTFLQSFYFGLTSVETLSN